MDYLGKVYHNRCVRLQERLEWLNEQIKTLQEVSDPLKFVAQAAKKYGTGEHFGEHWPRLPKGDYIPLPMFDEDKASEVTEKYFPAISRFGGGNFELGKRRIEKENNKTFNIEDLRPTQPYVWATDLDVWGAKLDQPRPRIRIAIHEGIPYIMDGHHAVVAARLRGDKTIEAPHIDMDSYDFSESGEPVEQETSISELLARIPQQSKKERLNALLASILNPEEARQ